MVLVRKPPSRSGRFPGRSASIQAARFGGGTFQVGSNSLQNLVSLASFYVRAIQKPSDLSGISAPPPSLTGA
jgi:hypothetical protein